MFNWLRKSSRSEPAQRQKSNEEELPFRPAKLPPRRTDQPASASDSGRDSRIEERAFSLTLPGKWSRLPPTEGGTRWTYRSDREQLTVSLMSSTHSMSRDQRMETLARVHVLRRKAEAEVSGVVLTETTFAESGGVFAARFAGFESATQRRFNCLLLCSQSAVTTFYYEALGMTEQESDARARPVFNSIRVT
jgi:hypothetical protein